MKTQSKSMMVSVVALLTIIVVSGIYAIFLINAASQNHIEDIESQVEILLYRLGAAQTAELEAFQKYYEQLENVSLDDSNESVLQRIMKEIVAQDKTVQLVVSDGRSIGADLYEKHTDAITLDNFFSSNVVTGRTLIEIEAYNAAEQQLIGAVSRKILDSKSGKSAVVLKLIDLSEFVQNLKKLFNSKNTMIYVLDENNRVADVFGSSNQSVDVTGIKTLATKAQFKGVLKSQKIDGQTYDVIYKEVRDLNWSLVILIIEPPAWAVKLPEIVSVLTLFVCGLLLLIVLYRNQSLFVFQREKMEAFEEIYEVFNRKDGIEHWELDERHISKQALIALNRMLPFIRINVHDKIILESALAQIQLGSHVSLFKAPIIENRKSFSLEMMGLLKAIFSESLIHVEFEADVESMDVEIDFNMLQLLMVIGDCIVKFEVPGRFEIRGDYGSQALVIEFYGELQRHTADIYRSLINNNEHYHLYESVNILKLGHKIVMNIKKETTEAVTQMPQHVQITELPVRVYFIEEFSPESMILQLMMKALGVAVELRTAESPFRPSDIIVISENFAEAALKTPKLRLAKLIVYGSKRTTEDLGNALFIERPYQLHKIQYALALTLQKED